MKHLPKLSCTWSFFVSWALRILSTEWAKTEPTRAPETVPQGTAWPVTLGMDWGSPSANFPLWFLQSAESDWEKQNTTGHNTTQHNTTPLPLLSILLRQSEHFLNYPFVPVSLLTASQQTWLIVSLLRYTSKTGCCREICTQNGHVSQKCQLILINNFLNITAI